MRVVIDLDLCQAHGACQTEAPEIFRLVVEPDGYAHVEVILDHPPEPLRAQAKAAERDCPSRAIRIVED